MGNIEKLRLNIVMRCVWNSKSYNNSHYGLMYTIYEYKTVNIVLKKT